jgi:hypothetical protein
MPYVKSIPIRVTVNKTIKYVLNPDKTENLMFATGINCVPDAEICYDQFSAIYKQYERNLNWGCKGNKKPVKAHHFVQSFKADQVTTELAFKIAQEWANKVFGDNRQVLIATHVDKGHIHTHFVVNSLDFNGKKYYSNKQTLNQARVISDDICKQYGIESIIGNKHKGVHYKEWMETKKGSSWKNNIRLSLDKGILRSNNLDELIAYMTDNGYEVKRGKYISIKTKDNERYVRTRNLGEDYTEDSLIRRIKEKDKELPIIEEINNTVKKAKKPYNKYTGMQLKYVSLIKLVSDLIVNGKKPVRKYNPKRAYSKENDYDINMLAIQLRTLNRENITSESELSDKYIEVNNAFSETKKTIDKLSSLCNSLKGVIENTEVYLELVNKKKPNNEEKLKLTIAKSIVDKYNINSDNDLNKLRNEFIKSSGKLGELRNTFEEVENKYYEIRDIITTYNSIKNESYLDIINKKGKFQYRNNKDKR